jgi:hypothetical protein
METYDPHKTTTEVRQGGRQLDNLWVLLISGGAIVVAFALIFYFFFMNTPPTAG